MDAVEWTRVKPGQDRGPVGRAPLMSVVWGTSSLLGGDSHHKEFDSQSGGPS